MRLCQRVETFDGLACGYVIGSRLETVCLWLYQMIETKMKKLLTAPPKVPLPSLAKILHNVPWIADNEDLVQFLKVPICLCLCIFVHIQSVSVSFFLRARVYMCVYV